MEGITAPGGHIWRWTLIRDMVLSVLYKCKDVQFLTLVNLLDNYVPLALSISPSSSSAMVMNFSCELYVPVLVALLGYVCRLSKASLQQSIINIAFHVYPFAAELIAYDKYPVENFHSRTKETDTLEEITFKAREIDNCKHELHSFKKCLYHPENLHLAIKNKSIKDKGSKVPDQQV